MYQIELAFELTELNICILLQPILQLNQLLLSNGLQLCLLFGIHVLLYVNGKLA